MEGSADIEQSADLTVLVLTLNEARHIQRCVSSVKGLAARVVVIDSYSIDNTCELAMLSGADVLQNRFSSHAQQLNWGLKHAQIDTAWVMKLDADEYVTPELATALKTTLSVASGDIAGFTLNLRRCFMGKWLRHGALYPLQLLRVWRAGNGHSENRLMDEHIVVNGKVGHVDADFVDDNLNTVTWWTDKHNRYASREAAEMLLLVERDFAQVDVPGSIGRRARAKRWIKIRVYSRLPLGLRALLYFCYRYFLRLGFLDGWQGLIFHVLQGFWYRFLVDVKVYEVKQYMVIHEATLHDAIREVLRLDVGDAQDESSF